VILFIRLLLLTLFAAITGCIASLAALSFVHVVGWLNEWLLISPRSRMMAGNTLLLSVTTVLVPAVGGLLVGLLWTLIKERRPHGPPDAILAAQTMVGKLPARTGVLSATGSAISLGCGASVGQYGPLVHMGATLGSQLSTGLINIVKLLPRALQRNSRILVTTQDSLGVIGIGCGAAAAIATAFNAPIAGLVFAHEVILRHYSIRAFAPVTVAATIGYIMANVVFDQAPLFHMNPLVLKHPAEYISFIGIGVVGALLAIAYMRTILSAGALSKRIMIPAYLKPMLAGAMLGLVALWQPEILGIGKELLRFATIDGAFMLNELLVLISLKVLLTALCIGFGFAGGVFSPALLIGALFGALAGGCIDILFETERSAIALYAICGMVAVTSPVIGAPLTTILIVFELTRNYDLALACMVSVVFANLIGYRLFGRSLFDVQLAARGVDLSMGRDKAVLDSRPIAPYISSDFSLFPATASLQTIKTTLISTNRNVAYVVDTEAVYCGTVHLRDVVNLELLPGNDLQRMLAVEHAKKESLVLEKNTSIWQAMKQLEACDFVGESIPVVTSNTDNLLLGVLFETSLVKAYLATLRNVRQEEYAPA